MSNKQTHDAAPTTDTIAGLVIPDEDIPLVVDFIAESTEHIESAETGLLDLEKNPHDEEVIHTIFRSFHTIKGMAGFLNLQDIGSLAHAAENLLDAARKGQLSLQGPNMDAIFESMDIMKKMMSQLKDAVNSHKSVQSPHGLVELLTRLKQCLEQGQTEDTPATPQAETVAPPPLPEPQEEKAEADPEPEPAQPSAENDNQLESVLNPPTKANVKIQYGKNKPLTSDEKIKVSTERLDTLIDMVGELVIANLMVAEEVKERLSDDHILGTKVSHLSKIVRELQELSMAMRMVPIQGVFHRMARLVRDLSKKSGKTIQFSTQGEETELDRTVVDKIADPLVHMIRNSVDHGIESPADRIEANKSEAGSVELRAF
ncbi:MAG: Hpt domain-containing protein, partial [Bacteroidales bacterium]|nr:Hpt domain-containing protein [Bacteroidales bacterium]